MSLRSVALTLFLPSVLAACGGSDLPAAASLQRLAGAATAEQTGDAVKYTFTAIDNQADPDFTELLGLNNEGKLVGFYGRGGGSNPNRGFVVYKPYGPSNFKNVSFPHSVDTQVSTVNNKGALGGWYSDRTGHRLGFMELNGIWYSYWDSNAGSTTKLFAINDSFLGVGYYSNPAGSKRAFEVDISTDKYTNFNPPHAVDAVATGITGRDDVAGWLTLTSGKTLGWLWRQGYYTEFSFPHSDDTKFLGITIHDWIVGSYVDSAGNTHGFLLIEPLRPAKTVWQSIDEPDAVYGTVVTGLNIHRDLVGYYVDGHHHTHGFLAIPASGR